MRLTSVDPSVAVPPRCPIFLGLVARLYLAGSLSRFDASRHGSVNCSRAAPSQPHVIFSELKGPGREIHSSLTTPREQRINRTIGLYLRPHVPQAEARIRSLIREW